MLKRYGLTKAGTPRFGSIGFNFLGSDQIEDIDGNIYNWVNIGTQQWLTKNLKTTKYADGTPIPNISNYNDWFLPSKDEVTAMYTELHLYGIGGFYGISTDRYASSSEKDAHVVWGVSFFNGAEWDYAKNGAIRLRACRFFTSVTSYNLRDIGPAGGWIFWKFGNNYLEAAPSDQSTGIAWSNITNVSIGTTGTAIGTGQANTTAIIAQAGHTDSAAKLCDDLTSDILWTADITGAYCWYDNDIANKAIYGGLYNWHAVNNAHILAPIGWRVPSLTDLQTLYNYLGGYTIAGGKLKETGIIHWNSPNEGATNNYNFTALPAGIRRGSDALFLGINIHNYLFTSTEFNSSKSWYGVMDTANTLIIPAATEKTSGLSVRCMRDL